MGIIDLIFPKNCLNCKRPGNYICKICLDEVRRARGICFYCRKASIDGFTHTKCEKRLGINRFVAIWMYEGVIRKTILKLKYNFSYDVSDELTKALFEKSGFFDIQFSKSVVFVPIPLHQKRKNWRGFNQSEIIGKKVADKLNYSYIPDLLSRKILTTPQASLKGKERVENIKGVFAFNPKYKDLNRTQEIILFDDVSTTGSTLKEAVKVLKRKGFEKVTVMTIART